MIKQVTYEDLEALRAANMSPTRKMYLVHLFFPRPMDAENHKLPKDVKVQRDWFSAVHHNQYILIHAQLFIC